LALRRRRAAAGDDRASAARRGQRARAVGRRNVEIRGQADGEARRCSDKWPVGDRRRKPTQVVVVDRIHDRHPGAFAFQRREPRADGRGTRAHATVIHEADAAPALRLQHAHEVGVAHRRQRMALHAALAQQRVADEQVPVEDRASVGGKRGRGDGEPRARPGRERIHQRIDHRPDVAARRAVERRAVFEVDLLRRLRCEPSQGRERCGHGIGDRRGARLQRDDDSVDVVAQGCVGNADGLHDAHAVTH
jgi:hypothetical protein